MLALILASSSAFGRPEESTLADSEVPELRPPGDRALLLGRPIERVVFETVGGRWPSLPVLPWLRPGIVLSSSLTQRAVKALADTGNFARVELRGEFGPAGVVLTFVLEPRRIVSDVRVVDGSLPLEETLDRIQLRPGAEVTANELPRIEERARSLYVERGFPGARVSVQAIDTDDPMAVLVLLHIEKGAPASVVARRFRVSPPESLSRVRPELAGYGVGRGDRADEQALAKSDRDLESRLRRSGWFDAKVSHRSIRASGLGGSVVEVFVQAGPKYRVRLEGNATFDTTLLHDALGELDAEELNLATLEERLRTFYRKRGFLDAEVRAAKRGGPGDPLHDLVFEIREHEPVRVVGREYICLTGERTPEAVGAEIDSFLSEELPGASVLGAVDPAVVDQALGPTAPGGARLRPFDLNPWKTFLPEVYEQATRHLRDLYRSEGYLAAQIGPVQVLRRRCSPRPNGSCLPLGPRQRPAVQCAYDHLGLPLDEPPPDADLTCTPDSTRGVYCESDVVLHIPVKLGPRTLLYDVAFAGNGALTERSLFLHANLELGAPLDQAEVDRARRRILEAYAEEGFAFAEAETELELSGDRTRGRVRFLINESERVRVARIVVRGAHATSENLVRRRVALRVGEPYRRSLVRSTEERLATLGTFASVSVGFEDPYVPAREKVVVVSVQERPAQYLDVRPGFSTGEGFRIAFEYGHRNLVGQAIQLTLRSELGYLPTPFIIEGDVREKYSTLDVGERLERRNSATAEFPEVGLGPLFRLNVEGVDVRDNARDFGLTKDAGILTLIYRPLREFSAQVGASLERNVTEIFAKEALESYIERHPELAQSFRAPDGTTAVLAERIGVAWDRRDQPLHARRGTLLSVEVEHVHATPLEDDDVTQTGSTSVFDATVADFLRTTARAAGYLPLSSEGLVLALSLRAGIITHLLAGSRTYPDRLFFLGGVDSLRGFPQDSLVPEDRAVEVLDSSNTIRIEQIALRGGDAFVNPRSELRVPLSGSVETALFVDAGNLWTRPSFAPFRLRYTVGTGLRIATPVGPLVFDYGFNVDRILDGTPFGAGPARVWEDLGAFHFSVGLF